MFDDKVKQCGWRNLVNTLEIYNYLLQYGADGDTDKLLIPHAMGPIMGKHDLIRKTGST